jgi:hypothetical protein
MKVTTGPLVLAFLLFQGPAAAGTNQPPAAGPRTTDERPQVTVENEPPLRYHRTETEPNDDPSAATAIPMGYYGSGGVSPAGDIDWWDSGWQYPVVQIYAYCDTSASANRDSQLGVYSDDLVTLTLIEFDDDDGPNLSSCIAGALAPEAGRVLFRLNDYQNNGEIVPYDLHQLVTVDQGNPESEPNDTSGAANSMDEMLAQTGALPVGDPADWFTFTADAGDLLVVIMDDDPDDDGNLLDTELAIIASDGATILGEGDNGAGDANCAGAVVAPAHGTYFVRVTDGGSGGGDVDYRFVLLIDGVLVPVELQGFSVD